jgi:hypothetical protein
MTSVANTIEETVVNNSIQQIVNAVENNEAVAETVVKTIVDKLPLKEPEVISKKIDIEGRAVIESIVGTFDGDLNIDSIIKLLPKLIQHVDNYKNLSGRERKNMVVSMLNHIVDITDGPGDDDILDPVIKRVIPSVIDLVLEVDNGKLKIKKKGCLLNMYKKIFGCCR